MLPSLTKMRILIDFKINQDFIAKVLCINREKPMTMCSGKCYLSKELINAEEPDKEQIPGNGEKERYEVIHYYSIGKYPSLILIDSHSRKTKSIYRDNFYHYDYLPDVFHPPKSYLV